MQAVSEARHLAVHSPMHRCTEHVLQLDLFRRPSKGTEQGEPNTHPCRLFSWLTNLNEFKRRVDVAKMKCHPRLGMSKMQP